MYPGLKLFECAKCGKGFTRRSRPSLGTEQLFYVANDFLQIEGTAPCLIIRFSHRVTFFPVTLVPDTMLKPRGLLEQSLVRCRSEIAMYMVRKSFAEPRPLHVRKVSSRIVFLRQNILRRSRLEYQFASHSRSVCDWRRGVAFGRWRTKLYGENSSAAAKNTFTTPTRFRETHRVAGHAF